jgi:NAD+ synthase
MATASKTSAGYPRPELNAPLVHKLLVAFIRNEFHKVGVKRAVLGISGGVDSSLSAMLGAHALGPENVLGVMMPYKSSSKESLEHARLLADRAGIKTLAVDITSQIDAYFERFP